MIKKTQHIDLHNSNNSVAIQIIGENNSLALNINTKKLILELPRPVQLPELIKNTHDQLRLLSPYAEGLPYRGSSEQLDDMKAFLETELAVEARLLIGPGGQGKTRLAMELCNYAREKKWEAGFASSENLRSFAGQMRQLQWLTNTLVIVDYASLVTQEMREWFRCLVEYAVTAKPEHPKLRLLLLERHASKNDGWWSELVKLSSWQNCSLGAILNFSEPVALTGLTDPEQQAQVILDTLRAAGNALVISPQDPQLHENLQKVEWARQPLYLKMAALYMSDVTPFPFLLKEELADELAYREGIHVKNAAKQIQLDSQFVQHIMAYVTLAQGLTKAECRDVIKEEAEKLACPLPSTSIIPLLQELLPSKASGEIAPLLPDVIGEAFILRYLDGKEACLRAHQRKPREVIASLVRCAQHSTYRNNEPEETKPAVWLRGIYDKAQGNRGRIEEIALLLPETTTTFRSLAVDVHEALVNVLREEGDEVMLAQSLFGLAQRYSELGRWHQALQAAESGIKLYEALSQQRPFTLQPHIASSLICLGKIYSEIGKRQEAVQATERAIIIFLELVPIWPGNFEPDIARGLINLATFYSEVGKKQKAHAAAVAATNLLWDLARLAEKFEIDLAGALNALSYTNLYVGARQEAIVAAKESVRIRRTWAQRHPEAFEPELASSLINLGNAYSEENRQEALHVAEEAMNIYQTLAQRYPGTFEFDAAVSFYNVAVRYSEVNKNKEAVPIAEKAVNAFRALSQHTPEAFEPNLAMSLDLLGVIYSRLGRLQEALSSAEESIRIFTKVTQRHPGAFHAEMASSINNLALTYSELGRKQDAIELIKNYNYK